MRDRPDRERLCWALSVAALLVLAGCSGEPTPTCDVPATVADAPGDGVTTPTGDATAERLRITSGYDGNLTVVLRRVEDDATTFARRYPDGGADAIALTDEFRDGVDDRATVVADCREAWSATIEDGESYHLAVEVDGEVVVVEGPESSDTGS
jgi:hypothetical protein